MKILLFDFGSYTYGDVFETLSKLGHDVEPFYYHIVDKYNDEFLEERLEYTLKKNKFDCVFGVNFFPVIAKICHEVNVLYISWSYDSPLDEKLAKFFSYSTNRIFLFDRYEVEKYKRQGYTNVLHQPLAVNAERVESTIQTGNAGQKYKSDISFVGTLYKQTVDQLLCFSNDYCKGYVNALINAQLNVFGYNIVEPAIDDNLLSQINESINHQGGNDIKLSKTGLVNAILKDITAAERSFFASEFSRICDFKLYSYDKDGIPQGVKNLGPVKYGTEMNYVFNNSTLNLSPVLRSISSGVILRNLDILGAGGCLFTNYQQELAEYFTDGEEVIMYSSIEEAFDKASFYLANKDLTSSIAINGHNRVKQCFTYDNSISNILKEAF